MSCLALCIFLSCRARCLWPGWHFFAHIPRARIHCDLGNEVQIMQINFARGCSIHRACLVGNIPTFRDSFSKEDRMAKKSCYLVVHINVPTSEQPWLPDRYPHEVPARCRKHVGHPCMIVHPTEMAHVSRKRHPFAHGDHPCAHR